MSLKLEVGGMYERDNKSLWFCFARLDENPFTKESSTYPLACINEDGEVACYTEDGRWDLVSRDHRDLVRECSMSLGDSVNDLISQLENVNVKLTDFAVRSLRRVKVSLAAEKAKVGQ